MSTLRFEISMSLDGYVTAASPRLGAPMGDGGEVLHEWALGDDEHGRDVHDDSQDTVGARDDVTGRRRGERLLVGRQHGGRLGQCGAAVGRT